MPHGSDRREATSANRRFRLPDAFALPPVPVLVPVLVLGLVLVSLPVLGTLGPAAWAQPADPVSPADPASLTAQQVVRNMVQMNLRRFQALRAYRGTRVYRVDYRGFPGNRSAEMVVNVKYLSPGNKEFLIQSTSGSALIVNRVLKKLLMAEEEESRPEMERRSALTEENYRFSLIRCETPPSGSMYVLNVEPRRKDKFLYHGQIWVDAKDFAVVRLAADPAQNPSFWIRKVNIFEIYTKVSDFWLPARNHSVTSIRLGGNADLTIDYRDYEITDASRVSGLSMPRTDPHTETAHAQE